MRNLLRIFSWFQNPAKTLLVLGFLAGYHPLSAQCDRIGKVISVTPGCGVTLVDVNNGDQLKAVTGAENLSGGQYFSFKSEPVALPSGCTADNLPVVGLTCVSKILPCSATFTYSINNAGVNQVDFNALALAGSPSQTFHWDFGDGSTAETKDPKHNFPKTGTFQVCLTISDGAGCLNTLCQSVSIGAQSLNCGYRPKVTAVGLQMVGTLVPDDVSALPLKSVQWYTNKGTQKLSESQSFKTLLPEYGTYKVCVTYEVGSVQEGNFCSSSACVDLVVAQVNTCFLPPMTDLSSICVPLDVPVCGCNGQSYQNECEAIGAGLVSWWAGDCSSVYNNSCFADLAVEAVGSDFIGGYSVQFRNLATGDYAFEQLDFGDGTPFVTITKWDTITHVYAKSGIYRTNLSVWQDEKTVSSVTKIVITDAASMSQGNLPDGTDYILPGDANGDKSANMYDLLSIGVGYYTDGIPRPHASTSWAPQFGPNWEEHINAVNYKHVDCDGNGSIDDFDASVILDHYAPLDTTETKYIAGAPKLRITFDQDTITIDPSNPPAELEINANIEIGSPVQPALGLYGLAFSMQYPEFVNHDPDIFYSSDYFGSLINILPITKETYSRRQIDMGLVRKNKVPANGYGLIGKMTMRSDYIIIIDVVDRAEGDKKIPLAIPIRSVRGIDVNGNIKNISVPLQLDTVWIKLLEPVVKTDSPTTLNDQLQLYPNPATDATSVYTGDLEVNRIEVVNTLGQIVMSLKPTQHLTRLDTRKMQNGVYTLRVHTPQGIAEKRLIKQ